MRDLIGVGLALFLGVIGIFFAYGVFGSSNSNSQIQETFLELQQARTELSAYANQNGGYGTAAFTNAQIAALQLLPTQGSRLIGTYDSVVAFGQSRALLVWQRIIMPDGASVVIDNLPATDTAGYAGLEDEVDYHTWQLLKGVALSTLLGTGAHVTFGNSQSNLVQAIRQSTQESTDEAGQRLVEKTINIQPTITIRPGWPLRVTVHKDLVLVPYPTDGQGADRG